MDKTHKERIEVVKATHPLGWACENCFHVVKTTVPGRSDMKCVRYPPRGEPVKQQGQIIGWMSINPPVQFGEWCGEFTASPTSEQLQ